MKFKFLLCLALVLSGCAANVPTYPIPKAAFSAESEIYIVQRGDTEAEIAKNLCLSMDQLSDFNPGVDWTRLKIGQKLHFAGITKPPTPILYHNRKYDFTFLLPDYWWGYSVLIQKWDAPLYSTNGEKVVGQERGHVIVFCHPAWKTTVPYQDIPIIVFTRKQWDEEHQGKIWPAIYAGGFISELWHNNKYVFGLSSRYNWNDEVKGADDVENIIKQNCAAHPEPTLYPNP